MDCLFFLICDGSPTSREEYPEGMLVERRVAVTNPNQFCEAISNQLPSRARDERSFANLGDVFWQVIGVRSPATWILESGLEEIERWSAVD
jgi:hypothetical protein